MRQDGSIYLHIDHTAHAYVKCMMDAIFGKQNFRNEIVWKRTLAKGGASKKLPVLHDIILVYQKGANPIWNHNTLFQPYDEKNLDEKTSNKYRYIDTDGRRYRLDNLIAPSPNPSTTYEFLGVTRSYRWKKERMLEAYKAGIVIQTKPGRVPQLKRYLDKQKGRVLGDLWDDINPINSQAKERTGYPTQKPLALYRRIIEASSNEGDTLAIGSNNYLLDHNGQQNDPG